MLTKPEIDLLENFRLSPQSKPSGLDVTKALDAMIVELQEHSDRNLNGDQVTIMILQALALLLTWATPRQVAIPTSEWDAAIPDNGLDDPVGLRMDYDSIYGPAPTK